jgi:kynureninase
MRREDHIQGFEASAECAARLDGEDALARFRRRFRIPERDGREKTYFLGNSLGLQPVALRTRIDAILDQWAHDGVEAFFRAEPSWMSMHDRLTPTLSRIVGCKPSEVTVMNQLTVNLHLLFASFYRPVGKRRKILCEAKAFPSDQYMMASQARLHGLDPSETIVEVGPREGEHTIRIDDILEAIERHADELALVFWGGVNYYTGQVFDMAAIAEAARKSGARVGFDLAHAAGNIPLSLHDWGADFAAWCHYKYLNGGPGAVAGAFIHERHHRDGDLVRLNGWWGNEPSSRFRMEKEHRPYDSAEAWQVSTASPILHASLMASLEVFEEAGWEKVLTKASKLNSWLRFLIDRLEEEFPGDAFECITPRDATGCQASLLTGPRGKETFDRLGAEGFFTDWREPNVIRIAPVPMYNTFTEVWRFYETARSILTSE